eukprot:62864-Rhodomonas_salina.5
MPSQYRTSRRRSVAGQQSALSQYRGHMLVPDARSVRGYHVGRWHSTAKPNTKNHISGTNCADVAGDVPVGGFGALGSSLSTITGFSSACHVITAPVSTGQRAFRTSHSRAEHTLS